MPLITTRAVVLQGFAYSDSSRILRLLTREHGLRSVIAKGALRPKSRFSGLLEPFTEAEATFHLREGRDLHTLSGFDLVRSRQRIGHDLTAFTAASLITEIALRNATEEPFPRLYAELVHGLDELLAPSVSTAAAGLAATWRSVSVVGYRPELERCASCGAEPDPDVDTGFDVEAGGIACTRCRPARRRVPASVRRWLIDALEGRTTPIRAGDRSVHAALLRAFLAAHLAHDVPFRCLGMFVDQLQRDAAG